MRRSRPTAERLDVGAMHIDAITKRLSSGTGRFIVSLRYPEALPEGQAHPLGEIPSRLDRAGSIDQRPNHV